MADINKIIGIKVEDNASQNLNKIDRGLTKVTQSTSNLNKETKGTTQAVLDNGGAMGLLNEITGGLAMTFKDASEAIGMAGVSLNSFKGILAATGIGGIVLLVGYLAENWEKVANALKGATAEQIAYNEAVNQTNVTVKQTNQSIESLYNTWLKSPILQNANDISKANIALEELSKTIGVLQGLQFELGDEENNRKVLSLIQQSVDAYKEYNKTLTFRDNIQKALNKAIEDEGEAQRLYNNWLAEGAVGAESYYGDTLRSAQKTVRELRGDLDDANESLIKQGTQYKISTKSVGDYKKAQEEATKAQETANKQDEARQERLRAFMESYRIKNLELLADTELKRINLQERLALDELAKLEGTEQQKQTILEYYAKLRENLFKKEYDARMIEIDAQSKARIQEGQKENEELKKQISDWAEEFKARKDFEAEVERTTNEAKFNSWLMYWDNVLMISQTSQGLLSALQDEALIRDEGFRKALLILEKGLAVAGVWINEAQSTAIAKFNASQVPPFIVNPVTGLSIPNPAKPIAMADAVRASVANKINAGIATASIIAQTIAAFNRGGGGSAGSGAGGGGNLPAPSFNIVEASGTNQLAATIASQQNRPVNAYVVGSDVTTQQALDRNKTTNATFL